MTIPTFFYTKIINFFSLETNYIFVGGKIKYEEYKKEENLRTKIIPFNSWITLILLEIKKNFQ